jgi:hypothetical protein
LSGRAFENEEGLKVLETSFCENSDLYFNWNALLREIGKVTSKV